MVLTVAQLAERLGAELVCNGESSELPISGAAPVEGGGENTVTFATNLKHKDKLAGSGSSAVLVSERVSNFKGAQLIVSDVGAALIEVLGFFAPKISAPPEGIDPTAKVAPKVNIGEGASIGPFAVIDYGVEIGSHTIIGSGCKIGENTKVGENCRIDSNVVVFHNCTIGNNVVIQANSAIGSVGFGYNFIDGVHRLIPHNGGVVIEDFVEIGANCCVDRAKFDNTIIGAGTKIDNLVQIAHNVVIGKCCLIVAQVGISGSCRLGDGVVIAGQSGVADNITIGAGVKVGAKSGVIGDVEAGQKLAGMPARPSREVWRTLGLTKRLPQMAEQLKQLNKRIERLEAADDDKK